MRQEGKAEETMSENRAVDAAATEPPYPDRKYAWFVVGVLIVASLVAFIDRQVVAIVVGPMQDDLGVNDTQIGWLYGVFALFYAAAALPIATLADRYSRKHIIAIGIFLWSLMTIACGLTRSYCQIFLARIGVGVGEATLSPSTTSLIGDYFPREDIPLALSIFQIGPIAGSGIAFIIGGLVLSIVEAAEPMVLPWHRRVATLATNFRVRGRARTAAGSLFSDHPRAGAAPFAHRRRNQRHTGADRFLQNTRAHAHVPPPGVHLAGAHGLCVCVLERDVSGQNSR